MLLKSQELNLKKKDFFKEKIILLYGENQDLINDLNQEIVSKFIDEKKISKFFFEEDIIKNPENIISYYLNFSGIAGVLCNVHHSEPSYSDLVAHVSSLNHIVPNNS